MALILNLGLPIPVALAAVAVLGYLVGRWRRAEAEEEQRDELERAQAVVQELETISQQVRRSLATHHSSILQFKQRIQELCATQEPAVCEQLAAEAERILQPTLRLSAQIASAYDEIRQQTTRLMGLTPIRTDLLTGLSNRRALDELLGKLFAMMTRYNTPFAIALFDIDHLQRINDEQGTHHGDQLIQQLGRILTDCVRETDTAARFGGEEFVVVMPETDLQGATMLSTRLRALVQSQMPITISGGVAMALDGDTPQSLLARAESALYSAMAVGGNTVYKHTGYQVEPLWDNSSTAAAEASGREKQPQAV